MQQDQGLASAISQALATITAPDQLNRLQQAVQFSYPNLGVALGKRLADSTMPLAVGITPQPIAWLDPQGALHVYTSDFTPILVMKAPFDANGVPQMVDRNPSSGFDTLVKNLATGSIGWKSIFDALQAKLYAPK